MNRPNDIYTVQALLGGVWKVLEGGVTPADALAKARQAVTHSVPYFITHICLDVETSEFETGDIISFEDLERKLARAAA